VHYRWEHLANLVDNGFGYRSEPSLVGSHIAHQHGSQRDREFVSGFGEKLRFDARRKCVDLFLYGIRE
jgi:hypothetical protein